VNLQAVLKNESFKMPAALSENHAGLFGDSILTLHEARRDWAAFTLVVLTDGDFLLTITDAVAFTSRSVSGSVRVAAGCPGLAAAMQACLACLVDDNDDIGKRPTFSSRAIPSRWPASGPIGSSCSWILSIIKELNYAKQNLDQAVSDYLDRSGLFPPRIRPDQFRPDLVVD
jgi:hypothetical protein